MLRSLLTTSVVTFSLVLAVPALAQVQLDNNTAEQLTALGVDTSLVVQQDDVGHINVILASDADDATKKAEILKLLEEN
jgi:hypothetical protein